MLDVETKRRIDTARDTLVGKVPDPKSQVEQITIALIYKFMDDMDRESGQMGGKASFFTGEYKKYAWTKMFDPKLGGADTFDLYVDAISKMSKNPNIPKLFRDIFKNAYLPYKDPETLKLFLKTINEFTYDHSEKLGDAFEYLLSVLGSQGDAGQFRTPRHIIDFIVSIVDPKKDETVLDPACGTAGFLISAYKHILAANTKKNPGDKLNPSEKKQLLTNFSGYDISPDMVRLSLVNLYLHGFVQPQIYEYDTLTSDERWKEYADVILANPPFMSPKGGIKPHKRFSVQSNRSEVLFVDYMAEHLNPNGRAGIIVPEGIIFQSGTAYKALRKMLVDKFLVAVISLPAGVFNPYSGVKTSILILDNSLANKASTVAFFKVENDGFGLGAQRRANDGEELTQVANEIAEYLTQLRNNKATKELKLSLGQIVDKEKILENGEYNLSAERYRENALLNHIFEIVSLGDTELFKVESGGTPKSEVEKYWNGGIHWATLVDLPAEDFISQICTTKRTISELGLKDSSAKIIPENSVIVSTRATIGRIGINRVPLATNQGFKNIIVLNLKRVIPEFVALAMTKLVPTMEAWATGGTFKELSKTKFCELQIPLPSLEIQKEIVAEIEGYQKVIDGARKVLENYHPCIPTDLAWTVLELTELIEDKPKNGYSGNPVSHKTNLKVLSLSATTSGTMDTTKFKYLDEEIPIDSPCRCKRGDIYLQRGNTKELVGTAALFEEDDPNFIFPDLMIRVRANEKKILTRFLLYALQDKPARDFLTRNANGAAGSMPKINQGIVERIPIPVPSLETQQQIINEIEAEQALVASTQELLERFEKKIQDTIARVWKE